MSLDRLDHKVELQHRVGKRHEVQHPTSLFLSTI